MNEAQADAYGLRMVQSWHKFWPTDVSQLVIYAEDCADKLSFGTTHILALDLFEACPGLLAFKNLHRENPKAHGLGWEGLTKYPSQASPEGAYHYRFDAVKFAHKTFAVIHAAKTPGWDVLIWMDADTLTHRAVPADFLESLLPDGCQVSWLSRQGVYPECGFYCLDITNPILKLVLSKWERLYTSGTLFDELSEWHDSFVFSSLVNQYAELGMLKVHSLSGKGAKTNHPLANGPLGAYFDHLKGKYKALKRSPQGALSSMRPEPHWNQ